MEATATDGRLRQQHNHAAETCQLCDDWPARCGETFVCSVCGWTFQTCTRRVGGFPPGGEDICTSCWERREVLAGRLRRGWEIGAASGERALRRARRRAGQLQLLMEASDD
jgi:hypothetical protein